MAGLEPATCWLSAIKIIIAVNFHRPVNISQINRSNHLSYIVTVNLKQSKLWRQPSFNLYPPLYQYAHMLGILLPSACIIMWYMSHEQLWFSGG